MASSFTPSSQRITCETCAHRVTCIMAEDDDLRRECDLLHDDDRLSFRNMEGYADPTTFFAMLNIEWAERKERRNRD